MHARAMLVCRIWRLLCIGLSSLHFAFASLPSAEVEALREMFQVANLLWDQGKDPCALRQVSCHDNHTVSLLFFPRLNITSLPESIGQLKSLEGLVLNENLLTEVPPSIWKLQSLEMLDLSGNRLTSLPDSVQQLRSLKYLLLRSNQLVSLPDSIGHLRSLSDLDVMNNSLTRLPDSIGQMKSLNDLILKSNQLTVLPESLGQLQRLLFLNLGSNQLTELFESLGGLRSLTHFDIDNNQLTSLPDSIGELQSLHRLRLQSNKLTSLPESISKLQSLKQLYVDNNHLAALPDSIGNLTHLEILTLNSNRLSSLPESMEKLQLFNLQLDSNRLTSIPHLSAEKLVVLRAAKNRLRALPSFGNMMRLGVLSLHDNFLERLSQTGNLTHLKVALLHSNRIRDSEICKLGFGDRLKTLYLHRNALSAIPPCLSDLSALEVLTLHRNSLSGEVPRRLVELPNLNVLTLHENRLHGGLPQELVNASRLFFLSAHSNHLVGPIPPLSLRKDCVDDESFRTGQHTCFYFSMLDPAQPLSACRTKPEVALHCPKACQMCSTASARGPVLLLHDNRLSCSLPEDVTSWPDDMRSITLIGNMLGNGSHALPQWIHTDEHQPFLYLSDNKSSEILKRTLLLASVYALCLVLMVGISGLRHILSSKGGTEQTRKAHMFLLETGSTLSVLAVILFAFYVADARYYACSTGFSSSTLSNFSNPYHGNALVEWSVAVLWTCWIALGASFLRRAPTPSRPVAEETITSGLAFLLKVIYSCCWLCIVALLSFPSVAYAVVSAIPFNNTLKLSAWWLKFFHYQAALVMVLVDMFITPKLVAFFSIATGMRRSMLLMAARLSTMWLAAVCDESTEDYKLFNISLGDNTILEPKADLCSAKASWWSDSACPRAVINTMAPLLMSKMVTRAFLQPIITLLRWQMSYLEGGQLYMWRNLICTSGSLEHGQQASLLVTWAEVALLWGPLVPVLLPAVLMATGTNMLMCKVGHGHFGVEHLMLDKTSAGMSRRYLHGSLSCLIFFQNWFAWSSGMHGRWLLLLAAMIYALELVGFVRIVREDADVEKTAEGLFKGAFFNNGQTCCAAKRIYVQEKIYDEFVEAFCKRARMAVLGNGLSANTELGPLASAAQLKHVTELVEDARRKGGRVLCGGGATAGPPGDVSSNTGLFYLPTIVVDVAEGTRLVDEEQFGPVVPVMPYKDDEEAILRANSTKYGLGASIWSENLEKANEIANRLKAGTVWVNRHCEFIRNAPFGGIDSSGIGRAGDLGDQDLSQYTEIRTLCLAKVAPKLPPAVESLKRCPEVHLEERARSMLQRLFRRIRPETWLDVEQGAEEAMRVFPFQPVELRSALESLKDPTGPPAVILRGLPLESPSSRHRRESEASLMGVLGLLEVKSFCYEAEEGDSMVKDLKEETVSIWRRQGRHFPRYDPPRRLFRPEKSVPEFVAAMCTEGDEVQGSIVDFRKLRAVADPEDLKTLQQEPLAFFDNETGMRSERVLVAGEMEEDGSAGGATAEETQRLKEQIDAAEKRAAKAEQEYKDAVAKHSEVEKQNKELTELAANFGARTRKIRKENLGNERAKALAQAELVNMAKVWRAQRAVDECKGKKQVSQDRLEFWQDALNIAAAAAEALRLAEECRRKEKEVFMASFQCDSFLAAAETAIEASRQAEQDAQELIAKREAELQGLQEALQKANERLQQLQSHKHEKLQEKERLKGDKDAKQAELQEAEAQRKRAEELRDLRHCLDAKMMGYGRLLVLVFACGINSAAASSKRGIAKANIQEHQLHALKQGVSWGYNWELNPRMSWGNAQMDFFPMVHNNNFPRNAGGGQFRALLGFNEPDIHHQAAMNPWHAAAIWPEVERVARNYGVQTLVSPAMCGDIGKGTWWMGEFLKACKGCRIDAVAIHSYWCSLSGLQNLVENYKKFGKKIWLTEFACADQRYDVSMQGQIKFMKEVVPWLEQEPAIEKYAWFSYFTNEWSYGITNPNPDAGLVNWNGALSELGRVYVSLGSARRLTGNETDNVTMPEFESNYTAPIFA
eukprot:s1603_g10.t1